MRLQWRFRNGIGDRDEALRKDVQEYFARKLPRIERLLVWYEEDQRHLRLTLDRQRGIFDMRAVLWLPTGTLVAEGKGDTARAAVDETVDILLREIRRHKELVRKDYLYRRRRYRERELGAAEPYLKRDVEERRREAFFELLRPLLRTVRRHARRELRVLELEGVIPRGEVTPEDLVDEVVAAAWERFPERPHRKPLDLWLIELLDERLKALAERPEKVLLGSEEAEVEEEPLTPEEDVTEESYWLERLFETPERLTLEDLVPDYHAPEAWEELTAEEQRERLEKALVPLSPEERQALFLYALEGYDEDEIAMLQGVDVSEVRERIERARNKLAEALGVARTAA